MNYYKIGTIVNTHGLKGELKILSVTDFPELRYKKGKQLYIVTKEKNIAVTIKSAKVQKNMYMVVFTGLEDINLVEKYKGLDLVVSEDEQQGLEKDEYYYREIIGLTVETIEGETLGTIKEIMSPGANDVWVVNRKGQDDLLLPVIDDVIKKVDLKNQKVTIELMEGL
ncbi:16S rRNA-processing protein RimM [Paucilactobacillus oligofermentans DSM 15707 = LMG 22743]|uniref:Ribosome maturation factor RimM n=1 Tax=Paucilactobacillus oligofermentans DSM 15707 = LMG 22743 TaxID=1423778 RepID=A0A0R1RDQ2_9LACO|nr:ribosome maturation factor RimM [Paucilactobacillus oligofermentans]KRL54892.1 16S rRNA-processing protein RimM [Paucilactobacillus oligofermentans DSM 15707 = LMG 22743]CUS26193.1 Ribosome maturation factor RimM [Paucilactobacillus oligofermentans DSM 15707 = LMG 22743]